MMHDCQSGGQVSAFALGLLALMRGLLLGRQVLKNRVGVRLVRLG